MRVGLLPGVQTLERAGNNEGSSWDVGKNDLDALIFEAKRDIRVYAVGIHGPKDDKPRDFTVGYKYIIQEGLEGKELSKSADVITEEVKCPPADQWTPKKYFKYVIKEKDGILVKAGQCLNFALWILH